jgi:hypothetical protein
MAPMHSKEKYFSFIYGVENETIENNSAFAALSANSIHEPTEGRDDLRLHRRHRSAHR